MEEREAADNSDYFAQMFIFADLRVEQFELPLWALSMPKVKIPWEENDGQKLVLIINIRHCP